jgi:glycosyltransferase involved in cell wall biosynthesis
MTPAAPLRLRICLYSPGGLEVLANGPKVGGAEVQLVRWAHLLSERHEVTFLTRIRPGLSVPHGLPFRVVAWEPYVGLKPGRGALVREYTRFVRTVKEIGADVHLQRGSCLETFTLALVARLRKRAFVFHWASDSDIRGRSAEPSLVRLLFRRGRALASAQVCQTLEQQHMLPTRQRKRSTVIPNLLDESLPWVPSAGTEVLWVGTIRHEDKRPDRFLDLASELPDRRFAMAGDLRGDLRFQDDFRAQLAALPNVAWLGHVPRGRLPEVYGRARCLVNVSDVEGFPNTFLEACASGVPVVSLNFDPNGILQRHGAGVHLGGDTARLASAVEAMFVDDARWRVHRDSCLRVAEAHRAVQLLPRMELLLRQVAAGQRPELPPLQA